MSNIRQCSMSTIRQAVALRRPSASFVFHNPFGETKLVDFAILQLPNPFLCIPFITCVPSELAKLCLRIVNPDADGSIVRNPVTHTDQVFAIALQEKHEATHCTYASSVRMLSCFVRIRCLTCSSSLGFVGIGIVNSGLFHRQFASPTIMARHAHSGSGERVMG